MGKRKREDPEYIKKKIKKLEERLRRQQTCPDLTASPISSHEKSVPPPPPPLPQPAPQDTVPAPNLVMEVDNEVEVQASDEPELGLTTSESTEEALPEEFLLALGHEGEEKQEHGDPITNELALRWTKIMTEGLKKDQKEALLAKYPTPSNFLVAVAPIMNKEVSASLSELSLNRDKRIVICQNMTGKLMTCLAKSLTDILKGNINSKKLIEEINDAAKVAAEMYHMDTNSRKFFALSSATKAVQETCREARTGKFLFGDNLHDQLKAIETVKRTAQQIKLPENKKPPTTKPLNWRSPSQYQPSHRGRGGHQPTSRQATYQPPRRPPPSRGNPRHAPPPRRAHHRRY